MSKKVSLEDYGFPDYFNRCNKSDVFIFLTQINISNSGYLVSDFIFNQCGKSIGGFQKFFPELYNEYLSVKFPDESNDWRFCQKLWHFLQDDYELNLGKCSECGKRCTMESFKEGYKKYCCTKCVNQSSKHKEHILETKELKYGDKNYNNRKKASETTLERYGVENYSKTKECQEKMKNTCLERYGVENIFQSDNFKRNLIEKNKEKYNVDYYVQTDEYKEKAKYTCLKRYGVKYYSSSDEYKEKVIETCLQKYGVDNYSKTKECQEKMKQTCLERYGVENYSFTNEYKEKNYITKKHNNSFHTSEIEESLSKWFIDNNFKFIRQYKSDLYPFACDFYLVDYNLYVEIQGTWSHGNHPFDEKNKDDIHKLNIWKSKDTEYYNNAIETWTKRDVNKRNIANKNKLNYLEIFSCDIDFCIKNINNYINNLTKK